MAFFALNEMTVQLNISRGFFLVVYLSLSHSVGWTLVGQLTDPFTDGHS